MHKDFLLTISNMLILPPALKIFKKKILGGGGGKTFFGKKFFSHNYVDTKISLNWISIFKNWFYFY